MKKKLILNADDYGMSHGIVDGIIQCAQAGVITSTTIMATGDAFHYGISKIKELGPIGTGVHLDLSSGTPISSPPEIPSILVESSRFKPIKAHSEAQSIDPEELKLEFKRQIERIMDCGIRISHLDNHHNWIYFSPIHFRVLAELADEFSLPVRFPFGSFSHERTEMLAKAMGVHLDFISNAIVSCRDILNEFAIPRADSFWIEFTTFNRSMEFLEKLIFQLPDGIAEICVHPGLGLDRQKQELEILLHPRIKNILRSDSSLELANYHSIRK